MCIHNFVVLSCSFCTSDVRFALEMKNSGDPVVFSILCTLVITLFDFFVQSRNLFSDIATGAFRDKKK